jgi:hypothetical protein
MFAFGIMWCGLDFHRDRPLVSNFLGVILYLLTSIRKVYVEVSSFQTSGRTVHKLCFLFRVDISCGSFALKKNQTRIADI